MNKQLAKYTDRELLEWIYLLQIHILSKVNEIDNDDKQFGMNLAADLLGSVVYDTQPRTKGSAKLLKQAKGKDYMQVSLCKCNHKVTKTVHRLVAETFLENPNELRCVNHKDENKLNNNVENFEWCSAKIQYQLW